MYLLANSSSIKRIKQFGNVLKVNFHVCVVQASHHLTVTFPTYKNTYHYSLLMLQIGGHTAPMFLMTKHQVVLMCAG